MKNKKNLIIFSFFLLLLNNCSTLSEAGKVIRNEKIRTTDEFLVEKKQPLTLPPDFDKIPLPNSEQNLEKNDNLSFKNTLSNYENKNFEKERVPVNLEEEIIEKIKQN